MTVIEGAFSMKTISSESISVQYARSWREVLNVMSDESLYVTILRKLSQKSHQKNSQILKLKPELSG
jgi:hypothetical protein